MRSIGWATLFASMAAVALGGCFDSDLRCGPGHEDTCPVGDDCPVAAPGTGCGDLAGRGGHDGMDIDGEVVVGCRAYLPYGVGGFPAQQQVCDCSDLWGDGPAWVCPI